MKTALVCGAGGFIGSHMVKRLKKDGYWVRGVDLKYPEHSETQANEFIVGDCLAVLGKLAQNGKLFDLILMDPPSFSTTAQSRFTTRGGTSDLLAASLPLLANNGLMIASSNHQKVDVAEYLKELRRGALQVSCDLRVIFLPGQPEDFPYPVTFPEGRYLKYAVCVKSENVTGDRKQVREEMK